MVNEWGKGCESNACVEVLQEYGNVLVRSSKNPRHAVVFDSEEWSEFIEAVKRGEFDL